MEIFLTLRIRWGIFFNVLCLIIGIWGFLLVWYATVWGTGLISDSFQYLAAAKSLASHSGLDLPTDNGAQIPLTHYPPMFSSLLAIFEVMGINAWHITRPLNALWMGINVFLAAITIKKMSNSEGFALIGAILLACSFPLLQTHAWALSEPLYLCISLSSILLLVKYLESERKSYLLVSAILVSMSFLTRYVGIALVIATFLILLNKKNRSWQRKTIDGVIWVTLTMFPMFLWTIRNYYLTGLINNRSMGWVPITPKNFISVANTILTWFVPDRFVVGKEKIIIIVSLLLVSSLFLYLKKTGRYQIIFQFDYQAISLYHIHGLYLVLYLAVMFLSKAFFDDRIGFSDRTLIPMMVSLFIILSAFSAQIWSISRVPLKTGILLAFIVLLFYHSVRTVHNLPKIHEQGLGVTRKSWHKSSTLQNLQQYNEMPIYSNSPSSLYLWTDRRGFTITDFEELTNSDSKDQAILVVFNHIPVNPRLQRLTQGLSVLESDRVASVYLYDP